MLSFIICMILKTTKFLGEDFNVKINAKIAVSTFSLVEHYSSIFKTVVSNVFH